MSVSVSVSVFVFVMVCLCLCLWCVHARWCCVVAVLLLCCCCVVQDDGFVSECVEQLDPIQHGLVDITDVGHAVWLTALRAVML